MLYEEIQNEKSKIINEMVLLAADDDEDTEISFSTTAKNRGLQATEIGTFVVAQRLGDASFARGHGLISSKDGESASYFGSGKGKIQGGRVRWPGAIYNHTKEHMRRWQ